MVPPRAVKMPTLRRTSVNCGTTGAAGACPAGACAKSERDASAPIRPSDEAATNSRRLKVMITPCARECISGSWQPAASSENTEGTEDRRSPFPHCQLPTAAGCLLPCGGIPLTRPLLGLPGLLFTVLGRGGRRQRLHEAPCRDRDVFDGLIEHVLV